MAMTFGELVNSGDGVAKEASQQDVTSGIKAGLGLAVAQEQVEATKMKVEEQKNELIVKQASTVNSLLTNLARANPVIAKKMLKQVREQLLQLGADPNVADYVISDDATRQRQLAIGQAVSGKIASDPETAGRFFQDSTQVLGWEGAMQVWDKAQKQKFDEKKLASEEKQAKDKINLGYAAINSKENIADKKGGVQGGLTVGEKARDTKFAKNYSDFFDAGGAAGVEANLESLSGSLEALEKGKTSKVTGLLGDTVQNFIDPESANVKTNVTQVLIQGLKDTFGGQLSDGERKAMVESVYVDSADPKSNAKRVQAMIEKIKAGARAKELAGQYFEENGTLKGFKGTQSFDIGGKTVKFNPGGESAPTSKVPSSPAAIASAPVMPAAGLSPALQAALDKVLAKVPPEKHAAATAQFMQRVQQTTAKGN